MAKRKLSVVCPTATTKVAAPVVAPPPPKPVENGQIVYVSVLPKQDLAGNWSDASPKLFATEEAAQADCDSLNATRSPNSQFVVRKMVVGG